MKFKQHLLLQILCLQVFRLWLLLTPNDLWPPWKTIGIIYSQRGTYLLSLKFMQLLLLEISCLQGFETFTAVDLKWPLTSMKNNRDHLLTKGYLPTKFEVQVTFTSWDIVFTKFSHFDLYWPQMTFDLHEKHIGIIYSLRGTYIPSLKFMQLALIEISCLQAKASHTHTYCDVVLSNHLMVLL